MKPDLLDQLAAPLAAKLDLVRAGEAVAFEHVTPAARPFLAAVLARQVKRRAWIVCANVREQELLHNELLNWFPEALFFPEADIAPVEGAIPDPENAAERLAIIHKLRTAKGRQLLVLTRASLDETVPAPDLLGRLELTLKRGTKLDRDRLLQQLTDAGYEHVPQVALRGQFAVRGGIIDIFSFHHALPVRIELFDDEIESIRHFDLDAQTSVQQADTCTLLLGEIEPPDTALPKCAKAAIATCHFRDYIREDDLTLDAGGTWLAAQVRFLEGSELLATTEDLNAENAEDAEERREDDKQNSPSVALSIPSASSALKLTGEDFSTAFYDHGLGDFEAGDFIVDEIKRERFFSQLTEWRTQGWSVHVFCNNEGETERLRELVHPVEADALHFTVGTLAHGFTFPAGKVAVLSDSELFGRYRNTRARRLAMRRAREVQSRAQIDFSELTDGQLVVHLEHGIGRYEGMRSVPRGDDTKEEVLVVEFANDARLYIPLEQSYLLARYVGVGKRNPPLSVLGDGKWARAKKSAEKAVYDYAGRLLRVHAEREMAKGHAFPQDNKWQGEFEASFLYKETPDQLTAIAATKTDMESEQPMDRLICGDVGFGKTEVAIRAAFKAVMGGKQVAILVPTTVLAQQHYQTFRERMSDYPVTVDLLSRYRTPGEQRKTVEGVRNGTVDIVVGTHRLISKDIEFKDLGLVVIDEEQRFGVLHKERFKEMFHLVDMLTLSATPIPRTLYLSLMGAKDMSTIETPPPNRIPVETFICPYDERVIRNAINRELARQGQVFFLHNRVQSIGKVRERIQKLCPQARVVIGHGQMAEHELEEVMQTFISGEADVLVSTTIIESGLDIPNANTIVIDRADRFGLADLYQLRGRVGRAQHKAYAYLMLPRDLMTVGEARKRINAIKQYSSLGAGFKIAMRDLEIRGAGNILGTAQSGHIITIGFELYCALLRQAIAQIKGEKVRPSLEVVLKLDFVALREADYTPPPAPPEIQLTKSASRTPSPKRSLAPASPPSTLDLRPSTSPPIALAPAFLPASYIAESAPRIQAYRRLSEVTTQEQLDALRKTWRDRFGRLPEAAENLLCLTEIKISAMSRKITVVEVREDKLMLTRANDYLLIAGKFPRLTSPSPTPRLHEVLTMIRSL